MGPSNGDFNFTSKPTAKTFQQPVPIDASLAALSTAAAVAAIRAPSIASSSSSITNQGQYHPTTLVPMNGNVNQAFPQNQQMNPNVPQHHLVLNPMHLPPTYPLTNKCSTPSVFANTKLRRGKWTQEEEAFANALIEGFEKGTIQDCGNGCTLRAFLSRKLHCAPMRISKKYAGKSIGKHVFLSRTSNTSCSNQALQYDSPKLRRLEFQFHMSLMQEGSPRLEHENIQLSQALLSAYEFNPMMTGYPMAYQPSMVTNGTSNAMNISHHIQGLNQPAIFQWPIATGPKAGHSTPNIATTIQMQQSLYTVFKDAHKSAPTQISSHHTPLIPNVNPCFTGNQQTENSMEAGGKNCDTIELKDQSLSTNLDLNYNNMTNGGVSTRMVQNCQDQRGEQIMPQSLEQQCPPPSIVTNRDSTFLNDYEKSDQQSREVTKTLPFGDISPLIPNITTPSITAEDLDSRTQSFNETPLQIDDKESLGDKNISDLWMDFPLSADEYAYFAQQSAMAVSKHSAYCMGNTVGSHVETSFIVPETEFRKCSEQPQTSIPEMPETENHNTSLHSAKEPGKLKPTLGDNGAAFNETNLQIHLRAAEEKARVDEASKDPKNSSCDGTKHSSITIGQQRSQVNIISGSEQSSDISANGGEGSTGNCSGCGSDNASDDSASDEIIPRGSKMTMLPKYEVDCMECDSALEIHASQ